MKHKINWLQYLKNVRGYSAGTIEQYSMSIDKFGYWLSLYNAETKEEDLTTSDFNNYLSWCHETGLTHTTINGHRASLVSYYDFCHKFCGYSRNDVRETMPLKTSKLLPQYIPHDVILQVLNSLTGNNYSTVRARAMILIFSHCGLRCSELIALTRDDVRDNFLIVRGKGDKMRMVPLSSQAASALNALQIAKCKTFVNADTNLFVDFRGRKMSRSMIYHCIHNIFANACPPELAHPHALRHSFATICCLHGVDLPKISAWMGHADYSTTLKYMSAVGTDKNPFDNF